jgi:hypothetical protein
LRGGLAVWIFPSLKIVRTSNHISSVKIVFLGMLSCETTTQIPQADEMNKEIDKLIFNSAS